MRRVRTRDFTVVSAETIYGNTVDSRGMKVCTEQCISQQPMMIDDRYRGLEQHRDCASAQMQKECDKNFCLCMYILFSAGAVSTFLCFCRQKCIKRK